jgi:hypothetical protein
MQVYLPDDLLCLGQEAFRISSQGGARAACQVRQGAG